MYDGQWELQYEGVDIILGSNPLLPVSQQRGFHHMKAPDIGDVDMVTDDVVNARADGVSFGQDFRGGRLITFELGLRGDSVDDVEELSEALLAAWRGDTLRDTPSGVATLCTSRSGRLRQVYGRPNKSSTAHTQPVSAFMLGTVDFRTVNDLFYDGIMSSTTVSLVPSTSGGFAAPFTTPLTTSAATARTDVVRVEGSAPTQPIMVVNGPVTNPSIRVNGSKGDSWRIDLNCTLQDGQQLVLDCRPWVRAAVRTDGASMINSLTRTSRLANCVLKPTQNYQVVYSGTDVTGTTTMTFAWNNAYVSN